VTRSGSRHALVVAVSSYGDPKLRKLRSPAVDAARLASVLGDPDIGGFQVETALDEEERDLRRRIATFFSGRRSDDLLLVHFSCHGVQDDAGELHLAARDTETGPLLGATSIAASWLSEQIERSYSKQVVLFLDCCFSGAFPFGFRPRAGEEVAVARRFGGRGRVVMTASSAMEYSWEGEQLSGEPCPSVFTEAIVEGLESGEADRNGDCWVSVEELYDYVYERVQERMPRQKPQMMSNVEGRIFIARNASAPAVEPLQVDAQLLALARSHLTGARLGAVAELAGLLGTDNPFLAQAAREQLARLSEDDSASVSAAAKEALGEVDDPAVEPKRTAAPAASSRTTTTWRLPLPTAPERLPVPTVGPPLTAASLPERRAAPAVVPRPISARPAAQFMPPRTRDHVFATLLDVTIVVVLGMLAALVPGLALTAVSETLGGVVFYVGILPLGGAAYSLLLSRRGRERTLGQWLCSLRVMAVDGYAASRRQRMLREGLKWVLPVTLAMLGRRVWRQARGHDDGRAFYDVLAGTELVREARDWRR